ncbi:hypothetical protein B0H11DRAFT_1912573 [Mycena galericulata]|nr:hypothetical protein B0H11DRAFT_1912573 [Mycena galericulata]
MSLLSRLVLNGHADCGKSFLLMQAAVYLLRLARPLHPHAHRLVDASTPYTFSLRIRIYLRTAYDTLRRLGTPTPVSSASSTPRPERRSPTRSQRDVRAAWDFEFVFVAPYLASTVVVVDKAPAPPPIMWIHKSIHVRMSTGSELVSKSYLLECLVKDLRSICGVRRFKICGPRRWSADRTEMIDLRVISGPRRSYGDPRNILNIPAVYGARRWPEYLAQIIDLRPISGLSAGPADHSLPPVSVIKTVRKTAGGKELRSLPASAPLPAKPAKPKRKSSSSAPKSKAPPPPSPSPAQSDYAPSNDEEPEAEETEAEVEAEAEAETAVEAAASDGGPEDEDEFASTLHSHAEYDSYNHDVHPTTTQRRRDEMPINAPKLIPRALVITSILPQPYQRAMFSCPTCITRNTRCIFYKWNMACWACSQGSMRCAFTHSGVEFMRVQDRMEPLVGTSNSYMISLLTTLVRSRRNLELQYSIVRKFGMEYEQDLNDFAVHYFQAETVLPRHHFISKFESEDSVEMIQQLFDRLDVTYESALADYRKRHPPAKTQLYEPVQLSEPVYREAKELPAEEFSVPQDQLPLDFTNKFVSASDAASADIPQPPLTEQARRSQPPKTFRSDARPFDLSIVPDSVFEHRSSATSSSVPGPSTVSRPKPLSRSRPIDTPPIAVLTDSPSPPKPRPPRSMDAPQVRSSLLSEPHRPAWTLPTSTFGISVPAPARSSQSFLDVKKDSVPVFGPPGPLLSSPPPAPSSSSTAMTYRPYSERPDSTPSSSAQPAQRTRRPTPPDETMDSSWVPDSQNQFISSDTPSQVLLSPSLDPSRPLQPVEDDDMYGDYPDDAAPAQEGRQ